jgi:hypothetical protein
MYTQPSHYSLTPNGLVWYLCQVEELQLSLEFLLAVTHGHPANLQQMEKMHFYAILSQTLRRKSRRGLIVEDTIKPLLALVGRTKVGG